MRHYFKVNSSGFVTGVATQDGGFSDDLDLADDLSQHPDVLAHRGFAQADDDFDGFLRWDCPCPPEEVTCPCPHKRFVDYYVENGALVEKVQLTVVVDGVEQPEAINATPLDYPPGTPVELKLRANVPDGTIATITPRGRASIAKSTTEVTFTDGESEPLTLSAPAQGTTGFVTGTGKKVRQFSVALRGWA